MGEGGQRPDEGALPRTQSHHLFSMDGLGPTTQSFVEILRLSPFSLTMLKQEDGRFIGLKMDIRLRILESILFRTTIELFAAITGTIGSCDSVQSELSVILNFLRAKMESIDIGNKPLLLPTLVPSVSSFETQIRVNDAIQIQNLLYEPISLVSAYDINDSKANKASTDAFVTSSNSFAERGILMLDSGGYESSRIRKYLPDKSTEWVFSDYRNVCGTVNADLIFSFDYFIENDESAQDFAIRLTQECIEHHKFVDSKKLIPVVHLLSRSGERTLTEDEVKEIVSRIASELSPLLIAIPERELGAGIIAKCKLVKIIMRELSKKASSPKLHVLGCGNLLSFAFLASAGASIFDGLEWCRTLVSSDFHLHHFQQDDVFHKVDFENEEHKWLAEKLNEQYPIRVAIQNLNALQSFTAKFRNSLEDKTVDNFIKGCFGHKAGDAIGRILE
jgi:queuine/archaeosine tRNA-ribosyltransferase